MEHITVEAATMYRRQREGVYRVHVTLGSRINVSDSRQLFGRDYDGKTPDEAITKALQGVAALLTGACESRT